MLQELTTAGCDCRLARDAYASDSREGTHWTTSSHANRKCGALLRFTSSRAKFVRDWVADFEAVYESGITVQAAIEGRDAALASGSGTACPEPPLRPPSEAIWPLEMSGFFSFVSAHSSVGWLAW